MRVYEVSSNRIAATAAPCPQPLEGERKHEQNGHRYGHKTPSRCRSRWRLWRFESPSPPIRIDPWHDAGNLNEKGKNA
jgi:hypothetical protein